ncbi:hypothetical protein GGX14DRAFT_557584 [Mycena pura]|uniref:Uncharacterized protein n=1 Tax=Mycena pura TaxID=153505 RepID=A0AAD6YLE4_9AGAR|nr:hypothetical protein GGX14DRAFT_557584 [Mycena pura]
MSPPRPNIAGQSGHAADKGCHGERTPQDTRGGSRAPGRPATLHPASSATASFGVRRTRSPGLQEVPQGPDSAPSPKRR